MSNHTFIRSAKMVVSGLLLSIAASTAFAEPKDKIVFQVSENDEAIMNLALNNIANVNKYYADKGEEVAIELVTYGPGLMMLRDDKSPVKDRLKSFKQNFENVHFRACNNTLTKMKEKEKKDIALVPEAEIVPAGVIKIVELEQAGYNYIKP